ncbi:hypothetical protein D9757_008517 [Collybiopsis confluens]|uniref:Uncharacterized protein n=1 Tax=Collybiopsis confluens TaxID=2823264 RepID=A0A8H5H2J4_9AGAR|nr:hypothetical protein D9757_008517 [Collybiopsis confluens]
MLALSILITFTAAFSLAQANPTARAGKPTGGPAIATLTVFSGPFTCTSSSTPPPTTGEAGTSATVSITEDSCTIINMPFGGVMTSTLTQAPKTGTAGCWLQIYTESGCGLTLTNEFHGFPYNGVSAGNERFFALEIVKHRAKAHLEAFEPFGGVMTTTLTATPKERTAGCWLQIYTESGCGLTLTNEFHGFPFNGVSIGSSIGCVTPPVISYGAAEVLCD